MMNKFENDVNDASSMNEDDLTINTSIGVKSMRQVFTYLCSISGGRSVPKSKNPPLPKHSASTTNSAVEVKLKWRRELIFSQQDLASELSSSWQQNQIQVLWCGFLLKGGAAPWRQPQMRWFEVRKEPNASIVMQYQPRGDDACARPAKRMAISDMRRHAERDDISGAYLSVAVAGRRGRVQLSAAWAHDADELVSRVVETLCSR